MSRTLNKVMLIGNVGKDPELKYTPSGIPVATFRMATSESWKDKDGTVREHTDWHNVVAWRGLADVVNKILKKGTRVFIEGKIRTRKYDDKNNNRRFFVEILADNILLLDNKKNNNDNDEDKSDEFANLDYYNDSFDEDFSEFDNKSTKYSNSDFSNDNDDLLY